MRRDLPGHNAPVARPIGEIAKQILRDKRLYEKGKYAPLVKAWTEVTGELIARRTRVSSFAAGRLVVEVDSSVLLHELNGFMKEDILRALRGTPAGRDAASLQFRLQRHRPGQNPEAV